MQQHVLSPFLTGVYPHQHVLALELEIGIFLYSHRQDHLQNTLEAR